MVGAMAAYVTWTTGWAPNELSPIFLIFAIGGKDAIHDITLIRQVLPVQAAILESWPERLPSSADMSIGSPLSIIAIEYLDIGVCISVDIMAYRTLT